MDLAISGNEENEWSVWRSVSFRVGLVDKSGVGCPVSKSNGGMMAKREKIRLVHQYVEE